MVHVQDVLYLLDLNDNPIRSVINKSDLSIEHVDDTSSILSVSVHPDIPLRVEQQFIYRNERYYISEIDQSKDEHRQYVTAEIAYLNLSDLVHTGAYNAEPLEPLVASLLVNTDWEVGHIDGNLNVSLNADEDTLLSRLRMLASITGLKLRFDTINRTVSFMDEAANDVGFLFQYEKNLNNISKTEFTPKATVIKPYGKAGLTIGSVNNGRNTVENYDWYIEQGYTLEEARRRFQKHYVMRDERFINAGSLMREAEKRLELLSRPQVAYEVEVSQLSPDVKIGDYGYVVDQQWGVKVNTKIVRLVEKEDRRDNYVELNYLIPDITDSGSSSDGSGTGDGRNVEVVARNESPVVVGQTLRDVVSIELTNLVEGYVKAKVRLRGESTANSLLEAYVDVNGIAVDYDIKQTVTQGWETKYVEFIIEQLDVGIHTVRVVAKTSDGEFILAPGGAELVIESNHIAGGINGGIPQINHVEEVTFAQSLFVEDTVNVGLDVSTPINVVENVRYTPRLPVTESLSINMKRIPSEEGEIFIDYQTMDDFRYTNLMTPNINNPFEWVERNTRTFQFLIEGEGGYGTRAFEWETDNPAVATIEGENNPGTYYYGPRLRFHSLGDVVVTGRDLINNQFVQFRTTAYKHYVEFDLGVYSLIQNDQIVMSTDDVVQVNERFEASHTLTRADRKLVIMPGRNDNIMAPRIENNVITVTGDVYDPLLSSGTFTAEFTNLRYTDSDGEWYFPDLTYSPGAIPNVVVDAPYTGPTEIFVDHGFTTRESLAFTNLFATQESNPWAWYTRDTRRFEFVVDNENESLNRNFEWVVEGDVTATVLRSGVGQGPWYYVDVQFSDIGVFKLTGHDVENDNYIVIDTIVHRAKVTWEDTNEDDTTLDVVDGRQLYPVLTETGGFHFNTLFDFPFVVTDVNNAYTASGMSVVIQNEQCIVNDTFISANKPADMSFSEWSETNQSFTPMLQAIVKSSHTLTFDGVYAGFGSYTFEYYPNLNENGANVLAWDTLEPPGPVMLQANMDDVRHVSGLLSTAGVVLKTEATFVKDSMGEDVVVYNAYSEPYNVVETLSTKFHTDDLLRAAVRIEGDTLSEGRSFVWSVNDESIAEIGGVESYDRYYGPYLLVKSSGELTITGFDEVRNEMLQYVILIMPTTLEFKQVAMQTGMETPVLYVPAGELPYVGSMRLFMGQSTVSAGETLFHYKASDYTPAVPDPGNTLIEQHDSFVYPGYTDVVTTTSGLSLSGELLFKTDNSYTAFNEDEYFAITIDTSLPGELPPQ